MPPHSVVLSFIGACLLWVGWFGFNAGSALSAGSSGHQRICRHPLRRGRGGSRLGGREWFATASRAPWARSPVRGRAGGDHAGGRIRRPHGRAAIG